MVPTVKKSTASMLCACARRKSRQESPLRSPAGPKPASLSSFRTVVAETAKLRAIDRVRFVWCFQYVNITFLRTAFGPHVCDLHRPETAMRFFVIGVDPQIQVQRAMIDKLRTTSGGNQQLKYDYRILVSNFKAEKAKLQVWDRLPLAHETETTGVSLLKASPELSKDAASIVRDTLAGPP